MLTSEERYSGIAWILRLLNISITSCWISLNVELTLMLKIPKETHHFIISWRYFTEIKIIRAKYVIYSFNFELTQIFLTKTNGHQSICYLVEVQLKDLSLSLITINILLRITTKTKD